MAKDPQLVEALTQIEAHREFIETLKKAPGFPAQVVAHVASHTLVNKDGSLMAVEKQTQYAPGSTVLLIPETGQIIKGLPEFPLQHIWADVTGTANGGLELPVRSGQESFTVPACRPEILTNAAPGDKVLLDRGRFVALALQKGKPPYQVEQAKSDVTWGDIKGQPQAVAAMQAVAKAGGDKKRLYQFYKLKQPKGILLYGPPGNGKTMLGKALAGSLQGGFFYVKGPELLSKWVGTTEERIRDIFRAAAAAKGVIFFDEADALFGKRGDDHRSHMQQTIIPQFLSEMDGLVESAVVVILATNRPEMLDEAVVREGRIDRKILVGKPTEDAQQEILRSYLQNHPLDAELDSLATLGVATLKETPFLTVTTASREVTVSLSAVASGAFLANLALKSAETAFNADCETGIQEAHLLSAIQQLKTEHQDVSHDHLLMAVAAGEPIHSVKAA